jgi:hypothetical protein
LGTVVVCDSLLEIVSLKVLSFFNRSSFFFCKDCCGGHEAMTTAKKLSSKKRIFSY